MEVSHTISIDLTIPVNLTAAAPTGWLTDPYVVTLERQRRRLRRSTSFAGVSGPARYTRSRREPRPRSPPPASTRSTRGPSTWRATCPPSAPRRSGSTGQADRRHGLSRRPGRQRAQDHVRPHRRRLGPSAAMEWTGRRRRRSGPGASRWSSARPATYTLATRVRDNAGNGATGRPAPSWSTRTCDGGHDRAGRHDADPDGLERRAVHARRDRRARRRHRRSRRSSGAATATRSSRARRQPPFTVSADGVHQIETRAIDAIGNESTWRATTSRST